MSNATVNRERKERMMTKTREYFTNYKNYMILNIHKVQSTQFKDITSELPRELKFLFAKNKIMKKVLNEIDPVKFKDVISQIYGNVLIVFFDNADPRTVLDVSNQHLRQAFATVGDFAKKDIIIPAGPTGMAPEKITLFQSARMNTKINKGKIDVVSDHVIVPAGETVGISEANLLSMLNIMPFEFGMEIMRVYENGEVFNKDVLLIDESCIEAELSSAIASVAAISLGTEIITEASLPYEINNAYTDITKVVLGLGISIKE